MPGDWSHWLIFGLVVGVLTLFTIADRYNYWETRRREQAIHHDAEPSPPFTIVDTPFDHPEWHDG